MGDAKEAPYPALYGVLQVNPRADPSVIKAAHRALETLSYCSRLRTKRGCNT